MPRKAAIKHIAVYFPSNSLSNEQLSGEIDWEPSKILEKTGIANRYIAGPDETSSDLGVAAAKQLFDDGRAAREDVDFLIFCTQSPDYFLPTTACLVQDRLGLRTDIGAVDVNQGCSGFVYSLALAKSLIEAGLAKNVLVITSETYSKFINAKDRSVRTVFGDAAAATVVSAVESDEELLGPFVFGTDGRGAENLIVKAGGMRLPLSEKTSVEEEDKSGNRRSAENLFMNGPEIFNFTLKTVPAAVQRLREAAGGGDDSVDLYVLHQANRFMLDRLRDKMKIDPAKFCVDMEDCGNTVSSTIPIAIERAMRKGTIGSGSRLMLVGFGVGYSWAGAMMRVV